LIRGIIKTTLRNFNKYKSYTFINVFGLAIGIACAIIIFLWVHEEISYDKFHENKDSLYQLEFVTTDMNFYGNVHPQPMAEYLKNHYPEITHSTYLSPISLKLANKKTSISGEGYFVQDDFFQMFSFPLNNGNPSEAFIDPLSIIITDELARKIFGEENPVGRSIRLEDYTDFTVAGVLNNPPHNSSLQFDFLLSSEVNPYASESWEVKSVRVFVMLQDHTDHNNVSGKIVNVYNDHNPGDTHNNLYFRQFSKTYLFNTGGGGRITYVYLFSAMALIILLIACINFMNLSTARSASRAKEIGVKKVVGSSRSQLIYQFLSEAVILSFVALVLGLLLVEIFLPYINNLFSSQLHLELTHKFIPGILIITIFTGILAGSYPALFLSSLRPIQVFKSGLLTPSSLRRGLFRGISLRKALVITQFSLSIFFIICAVLIYNQLEYLRNKNLGFDKEHIVVVKIQGEARRNIKTIKAELLKNSYIEGVSETINQHHMWGSSCGVSWPGRRDNDLFDVGINWVDYDYLNTFKIEIKQGRFFSRDFVSDGKEAIVINEALARRMEIDDPVGLKLTRMPGTEFEETKTIIGVVKDYHTESLHGPIRPFILLPARRGSFLCIRYGEGDVSQIIGSIESTFKSFVPSDPFYFYFLDTEFDKLYRNEQVTGKLSTYITVLAVFIASLGLLGLAMYTIERKAKEIGIRKVLGSSISGIVFLLSGEFVLWVVIANIIAWPCAYLFMRHWLNNFAYRTDINILIFIFAGLAAIGTALLTIAFQCIHAAMSNPVNALRDE